jgi:hypothetical protein
MGRRGIAPLILKVSGIWRLAPEPILTFLRLYNMYRGWTKIDYQNKHCIADQTDKGT